jgi:hypothetical protein
MAASLSHRPPKPSPKALRGPAPLGASCDGPPAPRRLEQPSPCTSPISDVPRRHRGHRHGRFQDRRGSTCEAEASATPHLAVRREHRPERLPSCRDAERVAPPVETRFAIGVEGSRAPRTVLTSEPPRRASARAAESSSASAASPIRLAAPRASRRAMRRTDFCHLTSSYEYPRLVDSRPRPSAFAPSRPRSRLLHGSAARFGGPSHSIESTTAGVLLPS